MRHRLQQATEQLALAQRAQAAGQSPVPARTPASASSSAPGESPGAAARRLRQRPLVSVDGSALPSPDVVAAEQVAFCLVALL